MTTELEEQFFKVFGIEPKVKCDLIKTADVCICLACPHYKNIDGDTGECQNLKYPEITDSKLLEMICILSAYNHIFEDLKAGNTKQLKEEIIKLFFDYPLIAEEEKVKIQQLFKEEE